MYCNLPTYRLRCAFVWVCLIQSIFVYSLRLHQGFRDYIWKCWMAKPLVYKAYKGFIARIGLFIGFDSVDNHFDDFVRQWALDQKVESVHTKAIQTDDIVLMGDVQTISIYPPVSDVQSCRLRLGVIAWYYLKCAFRLFNSSLCDSDCIVY